MRGGGEEEAGARQSSDWREEQVGCGLGRCGAGDVASGSTPTGIHNQF